MLSLVVAAVFVAYLALSIGLVSIAVKLGRKRGLAGWKWGVPVALLMYLIPFWDHIPTIIAHRYYCATEGGFVVYKTREQWNEENPDVAGKLAPTKGAPSAKVGDMTTYFLNYRFNWIIKDSGPHFTIWREEHTVVDTKTGEVMGRYVDFRSGFRSFMAGHDDWRAIKFWLWKHECPDRPIGRFHDFKDSFK